MRHADTRLLFLSNRARGKAGDQSRRAAGARGKAGDPSRRAAGAQETAGDPRDAAGTRWRRQKAQKALSGVGLPVNARKTAVLKCATVNEGFHVAVRGGLLGAVKE